MARGNTQWIGQRLAAARMFRGWESHELAQRSGLSPRRIERCEATGVLTCVELERLAAALGLSVAHFLEHCTLCQSPPAPAPISAQTRSSPQRRKAAHTAHRAAASAPTRRP